MKTYSDAGRIKVVYLSQRIDKITGMRVEVSVYLLALDTE